MAHGRNYCRRKCVFKRKHFAEIFQKFEHLYVIITTMASTEHENEETVETSVASNFSKDGVSGPAKVFHNVSKSSSICLDLGRTMTSFEKNEGVQNANDSENITLIVKENNTLRKDYSCLTISIYSAVVIAMVCIFLVLGRDYIKYVLLSLEKSNLWISIVVFSLLFTAVSFPMTWGYILLNVACGYLYGLLLGIVIVVMCALCGLTMAHLLIKKFLQDFVFNRLANDSMRALIRVVDSEHGFKVVVLARLTPIPFGLQNALFAMSTMSLQRYIAASITGMLPTQGLHAYFGSTLRSMEEVISTSSGSSTAYIVFGAQLLMVGVLLIFVIRKARLEFNRMLQQTESSEKSSGGSDCCHSCLVNVDSTKTNHILNNSHVLQNSNCI